MAKSREDHCHGQRCMDAGDLAPLVTEFARHLTMLGHKSLTAAAMTLQPVTSRNG